MIVPTHATDRPAIFCNFKISGCWFDPGRGHMMATAGAIESRHPYTKQETNVQTRQRCTSPHAARRAAAPDWPFPPNSKVFGFAGTVKATKGAKTSHVHLLVE